MALEPRLQRVSRRVTGRFDTPTLRVHPRLASERLQKFAGICQGKQNAKLSQRPKWEGAVIGAIIGAADLEEWGV